MIWSHFTTLLYSHFDHLAPLCIAAAATNRFRPSKNEGQKNKYKQKARFGALRVSPGWNISLRAS